jgi:hypothetical protein
MKDTSKPTQSLTRTERRGAKLTVSTAKAVLRLVAKRCSEREACARLGVPYSTWTHWKMRNSERAENILDQILAAKVDIHLGNIEDAAYGKGPHQKADWRASDTYLQRVLPSRFATNAPAPEPPTISHERALADFALALKLVMAERKARGIVDVQATVDAPSGPKQLQDAPAGSEGGKL